METCCSGSSVVKQPREQRPQVHLPVINSRGASGPFPRDSETRVQPLGELTISGVDMSEGGVRCGRRLSGGEGRRDWLLGWGWLSTDNDFLEQLEDWGSWWYRLPQAPLNPATCGPSQRREWTTSPQVMAHQRGFPPLQHRQHFWAQSIHSSTTSLESSR